MIGCGDVVSINEGGAGGDKEVSSKEAKLPNEEMEMAGVVLALVVAVEMR